MLSNGIVFVALGKLIAWKLTPKDIKREGASLGESKNPTPKTTVIQLGGCLRKIAVDSSLLRRHCVAALIINTCEQSLLLRYLCGPLGHLSLVP